MKSIPTQRATARITALEPPIQTCPMKHVPTRRATLAGQLLLRTDHAVANATLGLALQRGGDVLAPRHEPLNEASTVAFAGEIDHALRCDQPGAPFLLVDADSVHGVDGCALERVGGWEVDGDGHCLLVDGDGCGYLAG